MERQVLAVAGAGLGEAPLDVAVGELLEVGRAAERGEQLGGLLGGTDVGAEDVRGPADDQQAGGERVGRVEALPGLERVLRVGSSSRCSAVAAGAGTVRA